VKGLWLPVRRVDEVRVRRAEIASKFVEGCSPNEPAGRHIQLAVFGVEFVNRGAAARCITLAEDLLKVALKQFVDTVTHMHFSLDVVAISFQHYERNRNCLVCFRQFCSNSAAGESRMALRSTESGARRPLYLKLRGRSENAGAI
jgi:hypothetical protein